MKILCFINSTPILGFRSFQTYRRTMSTLTPAQMIQPPPTTGQGSSISGQVRVRQHLNPLSRRWSQPVHLPDNWYSTAFCDITLPLNIDVGVAKGRFLFKMAQKYKNRNYLGLEIREPLVHQANRIATQAGLTNLFYIACNANVSFDIILNQIPSNVINDIYVQFCDPWFKKRHAKRRMVNSKFVQDIFQALKTSKNEKGRLFLQTDVIQVALEMKHLVENHNGFQKIEQIGDIEVDEDGWLVENPLGERTEREVAVLNKDGKVYRSVYQINQQI